MRFEFATSTRIIFGQGTVKEVAPLASHMGKRALVVTGGTVERALPFMESLQKLGAKTIPFSLSGEPTIETTLEGISVAREHGCDLVIGLGGGSVIDSAKAIAALLANPGDILDYLEVIGKGKAITRRPVPTIAIPTTAGTGAEVTMNSVLTSVEHKVKVSLRSPMMLPQLAVVDPELTYTLPPSLTASTGLDAFTQLLEPFVSRNANPLTDSLCREGLGRAARSLYRAFADGQDSAAREDMAVASLFGGLALANAKLGAVHAFAAAIGGMFPVAHGIVCARLLPCVLEANSRAALQQNLVPCVHRFDEVARIVTGKSGATAQDGMEWIQGLCAKLQVPDLSECGLSENHIPEIVSRAQRASSMKGNPVELSAQQLEEILRKGLGVRQNQ